MTAPAKVNVPGIGGTSKKTVYLVGGVAVVVIGVGYYRTKKASAANASVAAAGATTTDPATGYAYGSAEDAAALAAQASYNSPGGNGYNSGGGGSGGGSSTGFTNNGEWEQAAVQYLTGSVGLDPATVSAALGAYIAGDPVDDTGKSIIEQAIAAEGYPPSAGTQGYPPAIQHVATPTGPAAKTQLAAPHLSYTAHDAKSVTLVWDAVPNAAAYQLQGNHGQNSRVAGTSAVVQRPGTFWVIATSPNEYSSQSSNVINV